MSKIQSCTRAAPAPTQEERGEKHAQAEAETRAGQAQCHHEMIKGSSVVELH